MIRAAFFTSVVFGLAVLPCAALDLSKAVVVFSPNLSATEKKAVTMLVEEVEKRTQIHLESSTAWPSSATPVIAIGPASALDSFGGK